MAGTIRVQVLRDEGSQGVLKAMGFGIRFGVGYELY